MPSTFLFYKPFNVLSQFTRELPEQKCLADYISDIPTNVYPIGRLDYDSEGLLLLSNDKSLNSKLLIPGKHHKTYFVQVEGDLTQEAIHRLSKGVEITLPNKSKYKTLPCKVEKIATPDLPDRNPPIRFRVAIPTSWLAITITEGKNRQVRKMCAKVGFPVLRLVRYSFSEYTIDHMLVGELREI
jgi:23S rRNA pseudouridine2457 synthase